MLRHALRRINLMLLILVSVGTVVHGQSGRSHKKTEPIPVPTLQSDEKNTIKKEKPKAEEQKISLVVVANPVSGLDSVPTSYQRTVYDSFIRRLSSSSNLNVIGEEDMNRSEAIKRAKSEKEKYVVWLGVGTDNQGTLGQTEMDNIAIEYYVFTPTTGKTKTHGRVYPEMKRVKNTIGLPIPKGRMIEEMYLRRAGEEAADRIIKSFNLSLPTNRPEPY
jgi:RNase H-fold protein (predicted Holliday junction resolvase)